MANLKSYKPLSAIHSIFFISTLILITTPIALFSFTNNDAIKNQNYYFEFLTFRAENGDKTYLEAYCQIPVNDFYFTNCNNGFCASYNIFIGFFDQNDNKVAWEFYSDSVKTENQGIINYLSPHVIFMPFVLEPGEYTAKVRITDLEKFTILKFDRQLTIPDYGQSALKLSAIQIASDITQADNASFLVKNNMKIIPNVDHKLGQNHKKLFVYSEVYNLNYKASHLNKDFKVSFTIKDQQGKQVKSMSFDQPKLENASFIKMAIPIADLKEGKYEFDLKISDFGNQQTAQKSTYFSIHNLPIHLVQNSAVLSTVN